MIIPHDQLSAEAVQGILEDYATRDGTDYGELETSLAVKVAQLRRQLERGDIVIAYDPDAGGVSLLPKAALGDLGKSG
ncbi:MAG: YheU family protein [Methylococcaceae bacterium]|nr:YheU family protein [Methylococcaceae bacterium]